jgi:hypothetical protein
MATADTKGLDATSTSSSGNDSPSLPGLGKYSRADIDAAFSDNGKNSATANLPSLTITDNSGAASQNQSDGSSLDQSDISAQDRSSNSSKATSADSSHDSSTSSAQDRSNSSTKDQATDSATTPSQDRAAAIDQSTDASQKQSSTASSTDPNHKEWTVAVNLGANANPGTDHAIGADVKAANLKKLADETKGSSVSIVAQDVIQNSKYNESTKDTQSPYLLERFRIQDGKVENLPTVASHGTADDVKSLVKLAAADNSDKLALISQSHGLAGQGLHGDADADATSIKDFSDAVKDGLKGSNHQKLDMLDFDACMEGNKDTLDKVKDLSDNVVASPEVESGAPHSYDAQNLNASMDALIKNPNMSGSDLADKIVQQTKDGADKAMPSGTQASAGSNDHQAEQTGSAQAGQTDQTEPSATQPSQDKSGNDQTHSAKGPSVESRGVLELSHYDTTKQGALDSAVSDLGNNLAQAVKDPQQRAEVEKLIAATPKYNDIDDKSETKYDQRDLKTFAQSVKDSIASGAIKDPDGKLKASADQTLSALNDEVKSHFGSSGYQNDGGMSVFLPTDKFTHPDDKDISTPLDDLGQSAKNMHKLPEQTAQNKDPSMDFAHIAPMAKGFMHNSVQRIEQNFGSQLTDQQRTELDKANSDLQNSKTETQFQTATDEISAWTDKMKQTPLHQEVFNELKKKIVDKDRSVLSDEESDNSGWSAFLKALDQTLS